LDFVDGQVFAQSFRIIAPIATGSMSSVYEVEQLSTGKRRALKILRVVDPRNKDDLTRRFEQEARVTAAIQSEHVVDVIGAGVDEATQTRWLAMELLQGEPLDKVIAREGVLPLADAAEICRQLFHGIAAAHALPLVHRDIKPENIFLARARVADQRYLVKVLDFGVAKLLAAGPRITATVGTPLWMAPEQAEAEGEILPQTDVWSLGLVVFHLLTGKYYWKAAQTENAMASALMREIFVSNIVQGSHRARELGAPPLPSGFDGWFARCVNRDQGARFANAQEAWLALERVLVDPARVMAAARPATVRLSPQLASHLSVPPATDSGRISFTPMDTGRVSVPADSGLHAGPRDALGAYGLPTVPPSAPSLAAQPSTLPTSGVNAQNVWSKSPRAVPWVPALLALSLFVAALVGTLVAYDSCRGGGINLDSPRDAPVRR
jgi:serine/threonine protein kinase